MRLLFTCSCRHGSKPALVASKSAVCCYHEYMNDRITCSPQEFYEHVFCGRMNEVRRWIQSVDVNAPVLGGVTPLHAAAEQQDLEMAHLLLRHGADPTQQNEDGWTSVHVAVDAGIDQAWQTHQEEQKEDTTLIELLLRYNADPNIRSKEGITPIDIARAYTSERVLNVFR